VATTKQNHRNKMTQLQANTF